MVRKHKHIKLNEAELTEVVTEALIRLLTEKSGISDEVVEATNQILDALYETDFKNLNWGQVVISGENAMWSYNTVTTTLVIKNPINIKWFENIGEFKFIFYNFLSYDDIGEYADLCGLGGKFNYTEKNIIIALPCIDLIPLKGNAYDFISHELNHAYQDNLKGGTVHKNTYEAALNVLSNPQQFSDEANVIANLIYRLDKREIDANANELFFQLRGNNIKCNDLKDFNALKSCPYIREALYLKNNLAKDYLANTEKFAEAIKIFGISPSEMTVFIKKNISYLDRKIRHVIQRYMGEAKEGTKVTEVTKKKNKWINEIKFGSYRYGKKA